MSETNWVARRISFEADIPTYWSCLCRELRDAVNMFDNAYNHDQGFSKPDVGTKNGCFHVDLIPREPSKPGAPQPRSLDVCLERSKRLIISTINGVSGASLLLSANADGKAQVVDTKCEPPELLTKDQVSERLLKPFLFPE